LEQERADLLKRRQDWFDSQPDLDPAKLVFIDETGLSTKMARLRGRSPRGERCRAGIPHGHWKTTTFTGALRLTGMTAPMVLDGAMNGMAFRAYVEQVLVPTLAPGDIVVMDNLPAHKAEGVRSAIERAGAELHYLPPYSPDPRLKPEGRLSTRSRWPSPSSSRSCEPEPSDRSIASGTLSGPSSRSSDPTIAPTTSLPPAMSRFKQDAL